MPRLLALNVKSRIFSALKRSFRFVRLDSSVVSNWAKGLGRFSGDIRQSLIIIVTPRYTITWRNALYLSWWTLQSIDILEVVWILMVHPWIETCRWIRHIRTAYIVIYARCSRRGWARLIGRISCVLKWAINTPNQTRHIRLLFYYSTFCPAV